MWIVCEKYFSKEIKTLKMIVLRFLTNLYKGTANLKIKHETEVYEKALNFDWLFDN